MKVLTACLFTMFLAGICGNLYGQIAASAIHGRVLTDDRSPAEAATIVLLKSRDSSIVSSSITDKDGLFRFSGVQPDRYLVLVTIIGYKKSYNGPFTIPPRQTVKLPDIILSLSSKQLKEIAVIGARPQVETLPGKIILNIQNSITAAGSSAFDILRQSPGVRVDNNNNFSIVGRQSALIAIDGKLTNLSGEDLVGVLRSLQSNTIDRIELVTSASAKYDASGGGIINIILKKGQNVGTNGSVSATAGYGRYGKGGASVTFNNRTDKLNLFGNYSYSANKTFHDFTTNRDINFNNLLSDYDVTYNSVQKNYNNTFTVGTDYFITPNQTVGFLMNGYITDDNFVKNNNLRIMNGGVLDSTITAVSDLNRHISHINYNLNYTARLNGSGETISADLNYTTHQRSSAEYITNDFFDASGNTYRQPLLLQNLSPSNIHSWVSQVDFTDPLSKTSKLEAGLKYNSTTSNNDLIFGPLVNGVYRSNPMFSNHFIYNENVNAAYINYENKFDKVNLRAGLRGEQTIAMGNSVTSGEVVQSNYFDLFPQVLMIYNYDDKNSYSLSYNRGPHRPDYQAVNPFLYYIDLYDFGAGNPYLKPQYTNTVELSYNHNKTFLATLYTTIISNAYEFEFYRQNDASKQNINIPTNLGTISNYGIKLFEPVEFTNWWSGNFLVDASYQRFVSYPVNGHLDKGTQDVIFSTNHRFTISETLSAELSGKYETPTFYGISQYKAAYRADAGVGKQLFNNRGSLKLSVSDIFNTVRDKFSTTYQNLALSDVDKKESQVVRLTFSYRFGKTSVRAASAHNTGNKDEQQRIGADK